MAAPGMTSPIRPETFQKLQLNAGIFIKNLTIGSDADALKSAIRTAIQAGTDILGVTRGGGSFNVTKESRQPELDGLRYRFKGDTFIDSVDAYLSTTLVETTPANFALGLSTANVSTSGKKTTITMNTAISDNDYIESLCWVGDLANGSLVVIELQNALNTADLAFTFTDKGEGTFPVELHAHQANVSDYDQAPFAVYFLEPNAAG